MDWCERNRVGYVFGEWADLAPQHRIAGQAGFAMLVGQIAKLPP